MLDCDFYVVYLQHKITGMSSWRMRHEWRQSVLCQFFCYASLLNAQCVSADDADALCADDIQCDYVQLKKM